MAGCFIAAEMLCLSLSMCVSLSSPVDYSRKPRQNTTFWAAQKSGGASSRIFWCGFDSDLSCAGRGEEATKNSSRWRGEVVQRRARGACYLGGTVQMQFLMSGPDTEKII